MKEYYVCSASDVGKIRKKNEDNFLTENYYRKDLNEKFFSYECFLDGEKTHAIAVFDGMGGAQSGEIASFIAANCVSACMQHATQQGTDFDCKEAIQKANQCVCKFRKELSNNMGSTLVMLVVKDNSVTSYNVGDSRAYLFRDGKLVLLSFDHTEENMFKQMQLECGLKCKIPNSGCKNVLTQHLGIDESEFLLEPYVSQKIQIQENDLFLVCSDGLTNMLCDTEIENVLNTDLPIKEKVEMLIEKALEAGGKDNITVSIFG